MNRRPMTTEEKQHLSDVRKQYWERRKREQATVAGPITFEELKRRGIAPGAITRMLEESEASLHRNLEQLDQIKVIADSNLPDQDKDRIVQALYPAMWEMIVAFTEKPEEAA